MDLLDGNAYLLLHPRLQITRLLAMEAAIPGALRDSSLHCGSMHELFLCGANAGMHLLSAGQAPCISRRTDGAVQPLAYTVSIQQQAPTCRPRPLPSLAPSMMPGRSSS